MFGAVRWLTQKKPKIFVMLANSDDYPQLAEIHAQCFAKAWDEDDITAFARSPGMEIWLAKYHGAGSAGPLGFVILRKIADQAEIITIATKPGAQRRGVARALLNQAILELRRDRLAKLYLEVNALNKPAIMLYHSLGFKQVGIRENYYGKPASGNEVQDLRSDALVMELDLR
jgi:[ribosomal protein S18]-alanine N-acetyltransferase